MRIIDNRWVPEVIDVMTTVEIALHFHRGKNKDTTVRRTCNRMKHRMSPDMKAILHSWSKSNSSFDAYTKFMDKAGL